MKDIALRLPGITDLAGVEDVVRGARCEADIGTWAVPGATRTEVGRLHDSGGHDFLDKQDLGILSKEMIEALTCAMELVDRENALAPVAWHDVPLYVATGNVEDRVIPEFGAVLAGLEQNRKRGTDAEPEGKVVFQKLHPLTGLRGLTNSINHYIAKYAGTRGDSTTYGTTSYSGWCALYEGIKQIEEGHADYALVGTLNEVGVISATTHRVGRGQDMSGRESPGTVFILLASEAAFDDKVPKGTPVIGAVESRAAVRHIDLRETLTFSGNEAGADWVFFSGAMTGDSHEAQQHFLQEHGDKAFSWYPHTGYLGATSLFANLAGACAAMAAGSATGASCLDVDPFGRESLVRLDVAG